MRTAAPLFLLLTLHTILLIAQISGLSIGYNEAQILFTDTTSLHYYVSFFTSHFGQNDFALRLPMIALHLFSFGLLYAISGYFLQRASDRLWLMVIYLLLPGVTSAALVVDPAGLKIALTFLFVYLYLRVGVYAFALLPVYVWIDPSFIPLFIAVIFYGVMTKQYAFSVLGIILTFIGYVRGGLEISGIPEGRFLDALGIYAAIFSPIIFIYLFYVLYRRFITKQRDLLWLIGAVAFGLSVILSFRQKVEIQSFAPFLMIVLPLAAQTFFHTYRIRLRMFRRRYRLLFYVALGILILNTIAVFFNQYLYQYFKDPTKHFSYSMHVAKELALYLSEKQISCIKTDEKMQLRLRFYGITECHDYRLDDQEVHNGQKVTISYKNRLLYEGYVTKINN